MNGNQHVRMRFSTLIGTGTGTGAGSGGGGGGGNGNTKINAHDAHGVRVSGMFDHGTIRVPVKRTVPTFSQLASGADDDLGTSAVVRDFPHERVHFRTILPSSSPPQVTTTIPIDASPIAPPPKDRSKIVTGKAQGSAKATKQKNSASAKIGSRIGTATVKAKTGGATATTGKAQGGAKARAASPPSTVKATKNTQPVQTGKPKNRGKGKLKP